MSQLSLNPEEEYINEPLYSIVTSIDKSREDFFSRLNSVVDIQDINYEKPNPLAGDLTAWNKTFTISEINENDKFSTDYFDCTWIVCSWVSLETWKKISFLSHQDPLRVLYWHNKLFKESIVENLRYLDERIYSNTFSIWLFWWSVMDREVIVSDYFEVVKMIRALVLKTLDRWLDVLIWPNHPCWTVWSENEDVASHFHYDNEYWVLYSSKPKQSHFKYNQAFNAHDLYDFLG